MSSPGFSKVSVPLPPGGGALGLEANICNVEKNELFKGSGHTPGRSPAPVKQGLLEPFILWPGKAL